MVFRTYVCTSSGHHHHIIFQKVTRPKSIFLIPWSYHNIHILPYELYHSNRLGSIHNWPKSRYHLVRYGQKYMATTKHDVFCSWSSSSTDWKLFRQGHCTTSGLYLRWKGLKNTLWQQRLILHVITCYFVSTLSPPSYLARFGMCTMTHNSTCMHPTDGSSVSTSFLGCMQMLIYMLAVASGSSSTCTNVAGPGWSYINALQYAHHRVQSVTSS